MASIITYWKKKGNELKRQAIGDGQEAIGKSENERIGR